MHDSEVNKFTFLNGGDSSFGNKVKEYLYNEEVKFTLKANTGYKIESVSAETTTTDGLNTKETFEHLTLVDEKYDIYGNIIERTYSFTMPDKNVSITSVQEKIDYNVVVVSAGNGIVDPESRTANYQENVEITATADSGYEYDYVVVEIIDKNGEVIEDKDKLLSNAVTTKTDENGNIIIEKITYTNPEYWIKATVYFTKAKYLTTDSTDEISGAVQRFFLLTMKTIITEIIGMIQNDDFIINCQIGT